MRRIKIYDDEQYVDACETVMHIIRAIDPVEVSTRAPHGDIFELNRALLYEKIKDSLPNNYKLGDRMLYQTAKSGLDYVDYDIVYLGNPKEEQICAILRLFDTKDGGAMCQVIGCYWPNFKHGRCSRPYVIHGMSPDFIDGKPAVGRL